MFFLGIHGGHKEISVGIFAAQTASSVDTVSAAANLFHGQQLIESEIIPNAQASKQLVFVIDRLLEKQNLRLQDLAFIFVNQGPAPFTTLRTVLATVNALSFARNIPLVGIDSLQALAKENVLRKSSSDTDNPGSLIIPIALLDAFNNDVYYCFKADAPEITPEPEYKTGSEYKTGYENISALVLRLQKTLENSNNSQENNNSRLCLIGNGAQLHRQALEEALCDGAVWAEPIPLAASFDFMAQRALEDFNAGHVVSKLSPLYLKLHPAEITKQAAEIAKEKS